MLVNKTVNDSEIFTIVHPGPFRGKYNNCQAGIVYYDECLQRKTTLCAEDDDIKTKAECIYIERRATSYGEKIDKYNFVQ